MNITTQGEILVNGCNVVAQYDDVALIEMDLHSKYAEVLCTACGQDAAPSIDLYALEHTLKLHETEKGPTTIEFPALVGWSVFCCNIGRYTLNVALHKRSE